MWTMPPTDLTEDQLELWDRMKMDESPRPGGGQSWEQATEMAIAAFGFACSFEGIPKPPDDVIRSGLRPEP